MITLAFLSGLVAVAAILVILVRPAVPVQAALNTGPVNGPAADRTVCPAGPPTCDYASVQAAVDAANPGDVIKVAAGDYTDIHSRTVPAGYHNPPASGYITQVVYISKTVTVRGGYTTASWTTPDPDANPTTLDAQGQGRVIFITGGISPTIEGLRITGGDATGMGGSYDVWPPLFDTGGGVYVFNATVTMSDNQVYNNAAEDAGGLFLYRSASTLSGNTAFSNTASMDGGGLFLYYSNATLSGNTIISNTAADVAGGLFLLFSDAMLSGNTVIANTAEWGGGGLFLYGSNATLNGNTVTYNSGGQDVGGGLYLGHSDATLTNNVVVDNRADLAGSGLYISCSSPRLLHTTIARNIGGHGSGVYVTQRWCAIPSAVVLTNTILVSHSVGISVTAGNTATLNATLWHANTTDWSGNVVHTNDRNGDPAFAPDGYHLTGASAAIDGGVDAGVTTDIDGHHRPYGSAPDLGAHEIIATSVPTSTESTLVYTDTQGSPTVIQVPAGAVTEPTTLVYTPVETTTTPSGFAFAGNAFELDVYQGGVLQSGFTFSVPVTITLHYTDADVAGLDEGTLMLEHWNESTSAWQDAACGPYDRHPGENWLAVPICHLSRFALFGKHTVYLPLALRNH